MSPRQLAYNTASSSPGPQRARRLRRSALAVTWECVIELTIGTSPSGPGRPLGSRNRLREDFLADMHAVWLEHWPEVIDRVIAEMSPFGGHQRKSAGMFGMSASA